MSVAARGTQRLWGLRKARSDKGEEEAEAEKQGPGDCGQPVRGEESQPKCSSKKKPRIERRPEWRAWGTSPAQERSPLACAWIEPKGREAAKRAAEPGAREARCLLCLFMYL